MEKYAQTQNSTGAGNPAIGRDALKFIDSLLTPEEIAESDRRVEQITEPIKEKHQ